MKTILILEDDDPVQKDDWCRPLVITSMNGGYSDYYSFTNVYTNQPENNAKWVQVHQIFGDMWWGKTVNEINRTIPYEFARGDIPETHQYGLTNRDKREINDQRLEQTTITFGKHKGKTWKNISENYPDYYRWAQHKGLTPKLYEIR